jgi:protein O-GlcNAc transferase
MSQDTPAIRTTLERALASHQRGQLVEAESLYREVLGTAPDHFDALNLLGVVSAQRGDFLSAVKLIGRAIAVNPGDVSAHANLGKVLLHLERYDEALACYDRVLAGRPDSADALGNRGNALSGLKRYDEALASYDRAVALQPNSADVHFNRGNLLIELRRFEDALAEYDRALALRPDSADALINRGNTLRRLRRLDEAVASYDRALAIHGDRADVLVNRGNTLKERQFPEEALASYERALAIDPDFAAALNSRGNIFREFKRHDEALASYRRALAGTPGYSEALRNAFYASLECCDWSDYAGLRRRIVEDIGAGGFIENPFSFLWTSRDPLEQQQCARQYVWQHFQVLPQPLRPDAPYRHEKIRVAYLSADFHAHATAYLMAGLFEAHDTTHFDIAALSYGKTMSDDMRARLTGAFSRFMDVQNLGDRAIAQTLRDLEIDIAVDLKGYTKEGRPGIFAHRAAPVQVSYLGYPGTMGASFIDYIIADRFVIPPDHQARFDEAVVHLPDSYQVNDSKRRIAERTPSRAELGLPADAFVFCCFNNNYKITPDVFDVWMRLLRGVEGSVLWLLEDNAVAARNLRLEAERRGIAAERLVFAPRIGLEDHLARHRRADLFLDTLPYNAHTTASDALWAGLPVLTCIGEAFAGRVAASLLNAVGLPELVTATAGDYEALALTLATEPSRLADIRTTLARNRLTYPLFDTARFSRHIEAAYRTMWERAERGEAPAPFSVTAL